MSPSPDDIASILSRLDELAAVEVSNTCGHRAFLGTRTNGERLACLWGDEGPRCVPVVKGHPTLYELPCETFDGAAPPSWLAPAAELPSGFGAPLIDGVGPPPPDLLAWVDRGVVWLALRASDGWKLSDAPVAAYNDRGYSVQGPPADATALVGRPAVALRITEDDGGSGMGQVRTWLVVIEPGGPRSHVLARMEVGRYAWSRVMEGDVRTGTETSGLVLDTTLTADGHLRLTLPGARKGPASYAFEHVDAQMWLDQEEIDPRPALRARAGDWRLEGCHFVRADGRETLPCEAEPAAAALLQTWASWPSILPLGSAEARIREAMAACNTPVDLDRLTYGVASLDTTFGLWQSAGCGERVWAETPRDVFELDRDVVLRRQPLPRGACTALDEIARAALPSLPREAHTWTQPWRDDPYETNPPGWLLTQTRLALVARGEAGETPIQPEQVQLRWVDRGAAPPLLCARLTDPEGAVRAYACSEATDKNALRPLDLCDASPYDWAR